ncbi:MAG: alpha-hydroxy-acid oxidizing protein, partial [Firmicutes bacterium]|nr:alpha-hydroxy-acid oxidizing protein [Bacillota bacterium]
MNEQELLERARGCIGDYCKACNVCNGKVCRNQIPGPGAKGVGDTAIRNYEKWQEIRVNMDTICANDKVDTACSMFGQTFRYPFF